MARIDNMKRYAKAYRQGRAIRREQFGPDMLDTAIGIGGEVVGATVDAGRKVTDTTVQAGRKVVDTTVDIGKTLSTTVGVWSLDIKDKINEFRNREREPFFKKIKDKALDTVKNVQTKGSGFLRRIRDKVTSYTADARDLVMSVAPTMRRDVTIEDVQNTTLRPLEEVGANHARIKPDKAKGVSKRQEVNEDDIRDFAQYYHENKTQIALDRLDEKSKGAKVTAGDYARSVGIATFWATLKNKQPLPEATAETIVSDIDRHASLEDQLKELEELRSQIILEKQEIEDKYGLVSPEAREQEALAEFTDSGKRYAQAQYATALANGASQEELNTLRHNIKQMDGLGSEAESVSYSQGGIHAPDLTERSIDTTSDIVHPPLVEAELARFAQMYSDTEYKDSVLRSLGRYDENFISDEGVSKALYLKVIDDIDNGRQERYGVGEKTLAEREYDVERLRNADLSDEDFEEFHTEGVKHFEEAAVSDAPVDRLAYYNDALGVYDNYTTTPEDIEEERRQLENDIREADELAHQMYEDAYYDQEIPAEIDYDNYDDAYAL